MIFFKYSKTDLYVTKKIVFEYFQVFEHLKMGI